MREYELTVVYDLAVAEAGGPDASVELLTHSVETRGGTVLRVDHWGRRRMAYPIGRAIDADYVVSRVELDPTGVAPLEAALRIDEKVLRHLVVRADELPIPLPPREPRPAPPVAEAPAVAADATGDETAVATGPEAVAQPAPAAEPESEQSPVAETPAVAESESESPAVAETEAPAIAESETSAVAEPETAAAAASEPSPEPPSA